MRRIHICGASGTGKTTLAMELSKRFGLEYITTSAKKVWPEFGIKKHSDVKNLNSHDFRNYQFAILNNRDLTLRGKDNYITDRSPLDHVIYYLLEMAMVENLPQTHQFMIAVNQSLEEHVDLLIYLPFIDEIVLEDDNMRVNNKFFQEIVDSIFHRVINEPNKFLIPSLELKPILRIDTWDLDTRINWASEIIKTYR